jgi:hypothetical protein
MTLFEKLKLYFYEEKTVVFEIAELEEMRATWLKLTDPENTVDPDKCSEEDYLKGAGSFYVSAAQCLREVKAGI